MEKNRIKLYENKVWGFEVSPYGLENGYLDYNTLSKLVGPCILNNTVRSETAEDWEMVAGIFDSVVYQDYILHCVGVFGLNALIDARLLEPCGVVERRQLYTLLEKK